MPTQTTPAGRRILSYIATGLGLLVLFVLSRGMTWTGSTELHTLMEVMATMLALMAGSLAMMRYYSKRDKIFLLTGTAFIGTAFLDGYHATVSSSFFSQFMPSDNQSLIPWSWIASRFFISVLLFLSWYSWYAHKDAVTSRWEKEPFIYTVSGTFTAACFLFFVFTPLPSGYLESGVIYRPVEYLPALFFLATLIGYLRKGDWRRNAFEHWLVISLIINLAAQSTFMPTSEQLFDLGFDAAHGLKMLAYISVLIGLLINMYQVFEDEEDLKTRLRESETQHRNITESSPDAILRYDRDCRYLYINPIAASRVGARVDDLIGKTPRDVFPEYICVLLEQAIGEIFATGESRSLNYELPTANGMATIDWRGYPEFGADGQVSSVISVSRDITQYRKRQEEDRKIQKLESIGVLAGGIAHDFNNILVGLFGNISLAKSALPEQHESRGHLQKAEQAFQRATHLTKQFLTFAQGGEPVKTTVALDKLIEEVVSFNLTGSKTRLDFKADEALWPVLADEGQISQVFANLTINASQAMPEGGKLTIRVEKAEIAQAGPDNPDTEKFVTISVRDEGSGISPEHLDKVFDPYFSTKHTGRGLGLATVYSIVKQHNGDVLVNSTPGQGTSFKILLPAYTQTDSAVEKDETPPLQESRGCKVLVMDDEELVLEVTRRFLEKLGHRADVARHGEEAIANYRAAMDAGEPYDFIIMDLTIPGGMGGREALQKILAIDPGVRALVSSGYATDPVMANYREYGFKGIIPKPFTLATLEGAINPFQADTTARR